MSGFNLKATYIDLTLGIFVYLGKAELIPFTGKYCGFTDHRLACDQSESSGEGLSVLFSATGVTRLCEFSLAGVSITVNPSVSNVRGCLCSFSSEKG